MISPHPICPFCGQPTRLRLTPEELRVVAMLADGRGPSLIAEETQKCVGTVKAQLQQVYRKLGVVETETALAYVRLAVYWNFEMFQIGLRELGFVA